MSENASPIRKKPPISHHTLKMMRRNKAAKRLLWIGASFTLAVLFVIVGYVVINGLVCREIQKSQTFPFCRDEIILDNGEKLILLVHKSLRLESLEYSDLREIAMGMNSYWGYLTGRNRTIIPYIVGDADFASAVDRYLSIEPGMGVGLLPKISQLENLQESAKREKGILLICSASAVDDLDGFHQVQIRDIVLAVHPDVVRLQAGRRLNDIKIPQVVSLFSGEASVWSDVGGPSVEIEAADPMRDYEGVYEPLKIQPFSLTDSSDVFSGFKDLDTVRSVQVDSPEELAGKLKTIEGSAGLMTERDASFYELDTLNIIHTRTRWNFYPSFLFLAPSRAGAVGGIGTIIINTLVMIVFVLVIATPIGVAAAVYLVEYSRQGKLMTILRVSTDTLMGIPSILFGLFGMVCFSQFLHLKTGLLSGSLTLTLMILPTIIRTSEEALKSVPLVQREGSMALGVSKLQTIWHVVIPAASPGILTGIILGIGRAVGETAALLFTMGSNMALIKNLNSPMRVLSVHLYMLIRENISISNAFATATVLIIIVFLVNYATRKLIGSINKMNRTS